MRLITPASFQSKLRKSEDAQQKYRVYSLSLAPADTARPGKTLCSHATPDCVFACVGSKRVGMASWLDSVMQSRIAKTLYWLDDPAGFLRQTHEEIRAAERECERHGAIPCVRMNAFSDVDWCRYGVMQDHPRVTFWDYTAVTSRRNPPENYWLTYSWKGTPDGGALSKNARECIELLNVGKNVAVCFGQVGSFCGQRAMQQRLPSRHRLPGSDHLYEVEDGDTTDLRFLDKGETRSGYGRIIGLRLKAATQEAHDKSLASDFCQIVG